MKAEMFRSIAVFAALAIAGVCLLTFGQAATDEAVQRVLPLVGTALLASGLTFFLVQMTGSARQM